MNANAIYPSLKGKTVLVTGGGSGIGESIVRHFAAQGSRVGFLDIDRDASQALANELAATSSVHFEYCDLRDIEALRLAIANVRSALGPITVLVNNAAQDERHTIEEVTPDYWDERLNVNLRHHFFAAQAVIADMKQAGGGAILSIGSNAWRIGRGNMPGYTTAKAAIEGLTRSLARELGPFNIRVCCIVPGWVMTERQTRFHLTPEGDAERMAQQCLKRRLAPEDIARPLLFFASDDAAACTNQSYVIDGGWV
jgi:D-xylose 1-dehydrogenase